MLSTAGVLMVLRHIFPVCNIDGTEDFGRQRDPREIHLKCGFFVPSLHMLFQPFSAHGANESCAADVALFHTVEQVVSHHVESTKVGHQYC